jgi:hypothetical protein
MENMTLNNDICNHRSCLETFAMKFVPKSLTSTSLNPPSNKTESCQTASFQTHPSARSQTSANSGTTDSVFDNK